MLLGHPTHLTVKTSGTTACRKSRGHWKTLKVSPCKTRVIGRKRDGLNPNLQRWNRTLAATASRSSAARGRPIHFRGLPPPTGRAMENDAMEGDAWDAYVALETFSTTGRRDGLRGASPRVTESP
jgi:hypothetical protein